MLKDYLCLESQTFEIVENLAIVENPWLTKHCTIARSNCIMYIGTEIENLSTLEYLIQVGYGITVLGGKYIQNQ